MVLSIDRSRRALFLPGTCMGYARLGSLYPGFGGVAYPTFLAVGDAPLGLVTKDIGVVAEDARRLWLLCSGSLGVVLDS